MNYGFEFPPLVCYCVLFRVVFIHVVCLWIWMCVLFYYSLICLSVYTSNFKSSAGVPSRPGRDSANYSITAHHSYTFLTSWKALRYGGITNQKQKPYPREGPGQMAQTPQLQWYCRLSVQNSTFLVFVCVKSPQ